MIRLLFVLLFFNVSCFGQSIINEFLTYHESHHVEKIYIHHDKPHYTPGDTIWCKTYFVDGRTHQFFEGAAPIIYVDWMDEDGNLVAERLLKIDEGVASFEIPVPLDIVPGKYTLRAYTTYQRNFDPAYIFQKSIDIISDMSQESSDVSAAADDYKFHVHFFPEGGNIVNGINNNIAFKATDHNGKEIEIEGDVRNETGEVLKLFKSYHRGMGSFTLKPSAKKSFSLKARYNGVEKTFKLPRGLKSGHSMMVDSKSKKFIIITLESNATLGLKGSTLLLHIRGIPILSQTFEDTGSELIKVLKKDIPDGVVHITLFDSDQKPVSERIFFNKNPQSKVELSLSTDKQNYTKRENVKLEISSSDLDKSNLSLSVYNTDLHPQLPSNLTIENYLLLQSDLKGRISDINQYFTTNTTKVNAFLDLIMITHGWRRFTWTDVLAEDLPKMEYGTVEDLSLVGIVRKKNGNKGVKANVIINSLDKNGFSSAVVTTDNNGVFYHKREAAMDTVSLVIQASEFSSKKQKKSEVGTIKRSGKNNVDIEILTLDKPAFDGNLSWSPLTEKSTVKNDIITNYKESRRIDSLYHPEWALEMDELVVKAQRKVKREVKIEKLKTKLKERGMFYSDASQKVFLDDLPGGGYIYHSLFDIVRDRVNGVQIKTTLEDGVPVPYFVIRGSVNFSGDIKALVLMDGVEIQRPQDLSINPENIMAIDIMKGLSSSSVYGERGAGGVIHIITKDPSERTTPNRTKIAKGTVNLKYPGFYNAREFYAPDYSVRSIDHQQPDLRTTLFWAPDILIGQENQELSFYCGDKAGNYIIKAEGITASGIPFVKTKIFRVGEF